MQDGIANLSDYKLSDSEISFLRKGLSFVPAPLKIPHKSIRESLEVGKESFQNRFSLPTRTKRLIDCSFESIKYDIYKSEPMDLVYNVSKKEREALRALRANENISITKADKGGTTVILNTSHLKSLVHEHLADRKTYQLLETYFTPKVVTRFNQYLRDCEAKRAITKQQFNRLYLP